MAEIKYNGSTVNSVVSQITNIAGKFDPVANSVKTSTGVMVGRRGFDLINPGISADSISQGVGTCNEALGALVKEIRTKQVAILTYSQDKDEINAFVNSLSRLEYDNLDLSGIDSKISGWTKLSFAAKGIFASAGTFLTGFVEGAANFVETAIDTAAVVATGAASIFTKPYDLITGSNVTDEMWASTKAYVAEEQVASIADEFYANTEAGQWLKQNAYGFDTVRGIGKGVGYSTTMILAGNVFAGAGGVDAAVKGARLAKALPAMSGVLGFGNGAEEGWGNGATTEKGLMYGAAAGTWESIQWGVGVKIGSLGSHIDDIATVGAKQVFKDASKRVVLDTVDSGLEGFVQPALTMIYKEYDGDTLAAQYANAFEANGGWNGVLQQAAIGGIMSGASEAGDVFKYNRNAAKVKKSGGSTGTDAKGSSGSGSDTKTSASGDTKSETVLKGDGTNEVEARVEVQENSADVVVRDVATGDGSSKAVDTTSSKSVDTTSSKPVDTTPSKVVDTTPSKPVDTTPSKVVDTTPSKPVDTTPSKVVDTTPSKPVDTTPSKVVDTTPSKPVDTTPSKVVDTTPSKPVDTTPSKVVDTTPSKPVDTTPSKVVDTTPSKPVDTTPSKVVDTTSSKPVDTTPVQPASMAAGLSSLVGDVTGGKISGSDVSKAGVGVAAMAGLGKLGTSMSAVTAMGSDVDIDVDVKFTGDTGTTPTRTSRQLSGDLEKMSAALPGKQAKVDAAEANLAKYKSEAGDSADPKVVKKLKGEVSKAKADCDKQIEKMKTKAEQRSAVAEKEIDEKLASGSKKGLVGTEKGKLVDGEFTKESAKAVGEIDRKEFGKLLDQEYGKVDRTKVDEFGNPIEPKVEAEGTAGAEKVEVKQDTPATDTKTEVQPVSDEVRTELGITDNETYDSLATKVDKAVAEGKLTREQGDSLFDTIAEEQHFDAKEQIADLRRENAEYEQARIDNVERKELLVTQDGAKPESVKGYDEAVRQIDEKIASNNAKIAELEASMETKTDISATEVQQGTTVKPVEDTPTVETRNEIPVEPSSKDVRTELGITDGETYDSLATKVDQAVADGKLTREQGDSLFDTIAEEQHFAAKEQIADLRRENAEYEQARRDNIERKDLLVTQDGAKPESVKGYDEAVRQIDDKIAANNAKIKELETEINTPVTSQTGVKPDTNSSTTTLTTDTLISDTVIEPEVVALGNAGVAVAAVGKIGGGMTTSDVNVKTTGGDITSIRTSKQLGADLEKLSAGLRDKQTKLDTAKANLDKYKADMGDAVDPKVVKKLEGEVNKAQTEYDKQLAKVKDKAEQRNATAAREVDEKLASGSTKGLVGTEKGRLVDGEFTEDSAIAKGKISKKEFATEPATRDSLMKTEGADGTSEVKVAEAGQTDVNPISDDVRTELGITDNETYDSLTTKVEQVIADGKLTREQADDLFYKVAEEQKFDIQERISELRRENAEYEQARIDNVERKELLVTQDGAKLESVKGYDEAVRQIDERISSKQEEIKRLEKEMKSDSDSQVKAKEEAEARRKAEEEAEARRKADEEAEARRKAEEEAEARRKAEEEAEARRKAEEEAEARRKAEEEAEARRKAEEEAEARRKAEEEAEAKRKAEEEAEARRKAEEEVEARRKAEEEAEARRKAEEEAEARRKAEEEAEARRKAEEEAEARRKAEEEAEARRKAEEEAEARRKAEEEAEARRKAEEEAEARRKAEEEAEARRKAEEEAEARRKAEEEAEARRKAEEEAEARRKAKEEAEARRKAEEEAEARRKAEEEAEARRKAEEESKSKINSEEELGRLAKERDAELDRLKQKRDKDIDDAAGARSRQYNLEEHYYAEEVARLKKQYLSHDLDLGVYRGEQLDIKYTEYELKQRYETMYSDRFRELELQHQRRLDLIDEGYHQTINDINRRYSNGVESIQKLFNDFKGQVDRGELAGTALGAKKLISEYDRFVREQSDFEADRRAIQERYGRERQQAETAYRDHISSSDRFHEEARQMVRRGEMEPKYYLERSRYADICDTVGVRKLEMFFDEESSFVRRIHDEDAHFVLQQRDSRVADIEVRKQQELRDLETKYRESGIDVTDQYKKYELALNNDEMSLDTLKRLDGELEFEEILMSIGDDTSSLSRVQNLRKGLSEKISSFDNSVSNEVSNVELQLSSTNVGNKNNEDLIDTSKFGKYEQAIVSDDLSIRDLEALSEELKFEGINAELLGDTDSLGQIRKLQRDIDDKIKVKSVEILAGSHRNPETEKKIQNLMKKSDTISRSVDDNLRDNIKNMGLKFGDTSVKSASVSGTVGGSGLLRGDSIGSSLRSDGKVVSVKSDVVQSNNSKSFIEKNYDGSFVQHNIKSDGTKVIDSYNKDGVMIRHQEVRTDGSEISITNKSDGSIREATFNSDKTVTIKNTDKDGNVVITKFSKDKVTIYKTEISVDGTTKTYHFNSDGSSKKETIKYVDGRVEAKDYIADGSIRERTWDADGTPLSSKRTNPDGSTRVTRFENSKMIERVDTLVDGTVSTTNVKSDGSLVVKTVEPNGHSIEKFFNSEGKQLSSHEVKLDGTYVNNKYDTSGRVIERIFNSESGTVNIETYYDDLSYTKRIVETNNTITQTTFDKYGKVISESMEYPNGSKFEKINNNDGTVTYKTMDSNKTYEIKIMSSDGKLINKEWSDSKGTIRKQKYLSDGTAIRHTETADGYVRDSVLKNNLLMKQTEVRPNGSKQDFIRNVDGSTKITEYRTDGTTKVREQYADGSARIVDQRADGSTNRTDVNSDGSSRIVETNADGTSKITDKHKDGTFSSTSLDGKGRIVEEKWSDVDGTIRTQKSNGDGTFSRHTVEANGRVRDSVLDKFDNLIKQTEYRTDGTRMEYVRNSDGTYTKTYLDKYGNRTGREYTDKYGTVRTERFNGDGTTNRHTIKKDGTVSDTTFDRSGNILHRVEKTPDGATITTTRNSNGGRIVTEKYADGSTLRKTYDANNRLISQDVVNARGGVDHRTYNNPNDVRTRQQQNQSQADNRRSIMDRFRKQQPQVQQQMPVFRNADEVVRGLSNPLNETNLQKIARRLNDGQNIRPYDKIVTLNTTNPKTPPSLQAVGEFQSRFGIDRSKGYETYYNSKGTRIHHQGEYFDHITSRGFNTGDVTDRLYLNMSDYSQSYKFCELFAAECERRGIPYYFKTASAVDGNRVKTMQLVRDESIVIYSGKRYLSEYTNIASEIVSKYGFKLEEPPILTGKLKNNIGYGAEPNIANESFNSIRSKIIDSSVRTLNEDYRRRGLSINSGSYIKDLMKLIIERGSQCGIDMNNFCLNI